MRGFSLIELMIAVGALGAGLLAVGLLGGAVIRRNGSAFDTQIATAVASALIERMRENRPGVDAGAYGDGTAPPPGGPDCAREPCTPDQRAAWDLRQAWAALRASASPSQGFAGLLAADLQIRCLDEPCGGSSLRTVSVTWSALPGDPAFTAGPRCPAPGSDCVRLVLTP